jgi:hypothetical protein
MCWFDCALVCSDPRSDLPTWEQLLSHTLPADERSSLIVTTFLDHDQVKAIEDLSGDDAQNFIDMIDVVGTIHFHLYEQVC